MYLVIGVALALRAFYGVEFQDEVWPLAAARNFASGGRPFVSETMITQGTSLLLALPLRLYEAVVGDLAGVVLVSRLSWLAALAGAAWWCRGLLAKVVPGRVATGAVVVIPLFHPMNMVVPGYNQLGSVLLALFLCSVFALVYAPGERRHPVTAVLCGVLASLVPLVYPPDAAAPGGGLSIVDLLLRLGPEATRRLVPSADRRRGSDGGRFWLQSVRSSAGTQGNRS